MIEIKAETVVKNGDKGVSVTARTEGTGEEVVNETLTIIESLMRNLKKETPALYLIALQAIADNPWILSGDESNEEYEAKMELAKAMSRGILKGGLN